MASAQKAFNKNVWTFCYMPIIKQNGLAYKITRKKAFSQEVQLLAYNQTKRIGLHNTTLQLALDAATGIAGLLQRYKLKMSSLSNIIGTKAKDSNTYCTPRHITESKNGHSYQTNNC